jgi:hypothetical protein
MSRRGGAHGVQEAEWLSSAKNSAMILLTFIWFKIFYQTPLE